ncbi:MAG: biotin/lipoyl-binding protein [Bacteriovoracaceae bacterium]|nr:biotin/lipoyl-binding protein [Bacteriovoracaceae bacterium]
MKYDLNYGKHAYTLSIVGSEVQLIQDENVVCAGNLKKLEPALAEQIHVKVGALTFVKRENKHLCFELAPSAGRGTAKESNSSPLIESVMPGKIVAIHVQRGQLVKKGDLLVTMEAMKIVNDIAATMDGAVSEIFIEVGQMVAVKSKLVELAPTIDS